MTNLSSANFRKNDKYKLYHIDYRANRVDLNEAAHHEPPHKDLRCLQIQLLSSLVLKEEITHLKIHEAKSLQLLYLHKSRWVLHVGLSPLPVGIIVRIPSAHHLQDNCNLFVLHYFCFMCAALRYLRLNARSWPFGS